MHSYVYYFGAGKAAGDASMKALLGGKGANLAEMTNLGIPVPAGFTITTEVCTYFYAHKGRYPRGIEAQVDRALARVEKAMGARFGDRENPLLVSVRSGARASMISAARASRRRSASTVSRTSPSATCFSRPDAAARF